MSFNSSQWAANVTRSSERASLDSIDVDKVLVVAGEIRRYVGQWNVYDQAIVKIARAIVERRISPARVGEIIEATGIRLRLPDGHKHKPRNPGAFFMVSIKKELAKNGHHWNGEGSD
jgi:hypothetical protein